MVDEQSGFNRFVASWRFVNANPDSSGFASSYLLATPEKPLCAAIRRLTVA